MPAVPPSGERQSVLRPILLAALALTGLLGAAWMVWPRLQGPQATAPAPRPTPVAAAPANPAPPPQTAPQTAPPPSTAGVPPASAPAAPPAPQTAPATASAPPPPSGPAAPGAAPPVAAPPAVNSVPAVPQAAPPVASTPAVGPTPAPQAAPPVAAPPAVASAPAASSAPSAAASPAPATAGTRRPAPPSFDIVRINPRGQAVMAGRAEPGAEIVIRDGDTEIGRVTANARGEWVFVSDRPLPPGGRELTLAMRAKDGQEAAGASSVVLVVPERGQDVAGRPATPQTERPIALLVPGADAAPRVLQAPATADAPAAPQPIPTAPSDGTRAPAAGALGLEIVDYDDEGQVRFTGVAPPRTAVRVYVDNAPVGDVLAGPDGRWTLSPSVAVPAGTHALRLDQMTPQGRVAARVELPFQRASLPPEALREGKVVVQPGQSLWRIARARYGKGAQYLVIYEANRDAIRDPARIYPGQIFDLPIQSN